MNFLKELFKPIFRCANLFIVQLFFASFLLLLSAGAAYANGISPENIILLTNKEREKAGVESLIPNNLLTKAAENKARALMEVKAFQHNLGGKKFSEWMKETGYKYSFVGENLAVHFETDEEAISAWMDSKDHRKNLLNPTFKDIGVAVVEGELEGANTVLIVQIFGTPLRDKNSVKTKAVVLPEVRKDGSKALDQIIITTRISPEGLLLPPPETISTAGTSFQFQISQPNTIFIQQQNQSLPASHRSSEPKNLAALCYILVIGYSFKFGKKKPENETQESSMPDA
jgi:hypothetical protein